MTALDSSLALEERDGLPEALRVLLDTYPRESWEADPNFSTLIRFWLDRHMMFRKLMDILRTDAEKALDADLEARTYAMRLSRLGGQFVSELHGHHGIEDMHYFPRLRGLDDRLTRGFDILDRDHHALDGHLETFTDQANDAIRAVVDKSFLTDGARNLHGTMGRLSAFLTRHLEDEEDLIVPVLLKYAPEGLT